MTRLDRTSLTQRPGGRWLALLLALLLAMASLSSHGAVPGSQGDCAVAVEWQGDDVAAAPQLDHEHSASSCVSCSTAIGQAHLPLARQPHLASVPASAAFPRVPPLPERPPRA